MPQKENLLNKRFERLLVIDEAPSKNKRTFWKCKCDCGNIIEARADALKTGKIKSCGCLNDEKRKNLGKYNIQDITNQKFGKLIAIKRLETRKNQSFGYDWLCECECGNTIIVPITLLKNGHTLSCGCLKESFGEKAIANLLIQENIKFETQKSYDDLLSQSNRKLKFDFYLSNLNILIEFDGPQHYLDTKYTTDRMLDNDKRKNIWCKNNNISLYRIPYNELNNIKKWKIEDLLNDNFLVKEIDHYHLNKE